MTHQPQPSPKDDKTSETTQLLRAWAEGDQNALERLTPHVYRTLRRIAGHHLQNERPGNTLQATALVHEAYLELIDITNVDWQHRAHFFAVSAQIMRHILLDRARRRVAAKRGGHAERVDLDELPDLSGERANELIALEDALNALAAMDAQGPRDRAPLLRRAQRRRICRRPRNLAGNRDAGLEVRALLAAGRTEPPLSLPKINSPWCQFSPSLCA